MYDAAIHIGEVKWSCRPKQICLHSLNESSTATFSKMDAYHQKPLRPIANDSIDEPDTTKLYWRRTRL
jgi:hypothetical protein